MCLTSNIGHGFKVKSYQDHPVKHFAACEVPFHFSMDNWLLSGDKEYQPDPNLELIRGAEVIGWEKVKQSLISGAKAAFSPSVDQDWVENYVKQIERVFNLHEF